MAAAAERHDKVLRELEAVAVVIIHGKRLVTRWKVKY